MVRRDDRQGLRRGRPDRARRAVARDPRADRRRRPRSCPWNYPLIITAWKLGAGPRDRQLRRPQAGVAVAADGAPPGRARGRGRAARRRPQRRPRPGRRLGDALARHPGVDKIAFTGSTEVGKSLLRAVGEIGRQGDHARARRQEPAGRPRRRRRPRGRGVDDRVGDLLQQRPDVQRRLAAHRPSVASARSSSSGSRRSAGSWPRASRSTRRRGSARSSTSASSTRSSATSRLGAEEGARVVAGGERVREESGGFYVPPTILDGVDNGWRVAREEIFGPVLTVTEFEDEAEALRDRQRHAVRAGRRALDARRQPGPSPGATRSGPASSGSTRSTPPTSRSRSAGTSSRASGATRGWPPSTATPSSRRPGSTCRAE